MNDELSLKKIIKSFAERHTIRRNKSNKASPFTDEDIVNFKSERKKCNKSFKIHKNPMKNPLKKKLDECMKSNVFEPMTKLSDKWLMLYLNDELSFHQLLDSFVVTNSNAL